MFESLKKKEFGDEERVDAGAVCGLVRNINKSPSRTLARRKSVGKPALDLSIVMTGLPFPCAGRGEEGSPARGSTKSGSSFFPLRSADSSPSKRKNI